MKRASPASSEKSAGKLARFEGKRAHVESFLTYVKSLKDMLAESETLEPLIISAICRQVTKQLPQDRFLNYAREQSCSRNVEYILDVLKDKLLQLVAGEREPDEAGTAQVEAAVALLTLWKRLFGALATDSNCLQLSRNQYGSHTVEHMLDDVADILARKADIIRYCGDQELCDQLAADWLQIVQDVFTFAPGVERDGFWGRLSDLRATYLLRKLAARVDATSDSSESYLAFCRKLFAKDWPRLHEEVFKHERASPTLQHILLKYLALETDAILISALKENALPPLDCILALAKESPPANRMIEFILEHDLYTGQRLSDLYDAIITAPDLAEILDSPVKFLVHALLKTSCQFDRLMPLLEAVSFTSDLRLARLLIAKAKTHKVPARFLVERLKSFVCEAHGASVDWKERATRYQEKKEAAISRELNFWYMLFTLPGKARAPAGDQMAPLSFEGLTLACDLIDHFKVGYITTELMSELEGLLKEDGRTAKPAASEEDVDADDRADANTAATESEGKRKELSLAMPNSQSVLGQLAQNKKGALFLQLIVSRRLPDGLKKMVRMYVLQNVRTLVFNEYSSFLVKAVADAVKEQLPKEQALLKRQLAPMVSEIRLRNYALYKESVEALFASKPKLSRF